jgi:hypothetical protein
MLRVTSALFGTMLLLLASPANAYVWKCHTPQGDIWTSQPGPSDDCEEYDAQYNPSAAPPPATQSPPPQIAPQPVPPPPAYIGSYIPAPYYYSPGYYGPGVYLAPPAFGYRYGGTMGGSTGDAIGASSGSTSSLHSVQSGDLSKVREAASARTVPTA